MLITRPFTNEEVAAHLELGCLDAGWIAEACRRLRGLPGSGECERPEATPHQLKSYADWAAQFAQTQGYLPSAFDAWRSNPPLIPSKEEA